MLLTEIMICHACRAELKIEGYVSRSDECPQCGADIHCCLNCTNYDPHAHNKCREPQAEWVTDREKGNFCDFFIPNKLNPGAATSPASDPRSAFDNLFKK
jgi:hypothetical protein